MEEKQTERDVSHCILAVFALPQSDDEGTSLSSPLGGFQVLVRGWVVSSFLCRFSPHLT